MEASTIRSTIDAPRPGTRRWRRSALWAVLVALLVIAQTLLVALTLSYESTRAQDAVDSAAATAVVQVRQLLTRGQQQLQALLWGERSAERWRAHAGEVLRQRRELMRIERRDPSRNIVTAVDTPFREPLFVHMRRADLNLETDVACAMAQRLGSPAFSRSYFVPQASGLGLEVTDLCIPEQIDGRLVGFITGTFSLAALLEEVAGPDLTRTHELSFVEGDGTRLARAGVPRGAKVYVAERIVDLPNLALQLRVDSAAGRPQLIPNLASALVLGLSLALFGVVLLLARDVRRRARVEAALAEALAFRKAMEDSLVTGLRARDLSGRITYVNPAFCHMVGYTADELIHSATPPYWPPDQVETYTQRQKERLARRASLQESREGFETVFVRRNGERFPVVIYEAPLVDGAEKHTGWMSAVLDVSAQRRVEELSRQQQDRLQATARLATVGEMASLLSHELNQPLAAIASYASGSLNLMDAPTGSVDMTDTRDMLRQATQRIAEQAERAGRVIKSVHDFVRRREQVREALGADRLIDSVMPLVRLQARKSGTVIELDLPAPAPRVVCDRTMVEQVLLNLTRNGIQAMDEHTPAEQRVLRLAVRQVHPRWVRVSVADRGRGVAQDVARQLFTPFFTTRSEGMGLGLSLCRTVIEQHGGALDFDNVQAADGSICGAEFRFTLPALAQDEPSPPGPMS
jgi:two-component system sensor histidine kinase DctS